MNSNVFINVFANYNNAVYIIGNKHFQCIIQLRVLNFQRNEYYTRETREVNLISIKNGF